MGRAENRRMDVLLPQQPLHILEVHPPDALFVRHQRTVDDLVAIVGQGIGESNVGGGMNQDLVPPGAEHLQRACHATQNAVLVADVLLSQFCDAVV